MDLCTMSACLLKRYLCEFACSPYVVSEVIGSCLAAQHTDLVLLCTGIVFSSILSGLIGLCVYDACLQGLDCAAKLL